MNTQDLQPFIERLTKQLDLEKIYHFHDIINGKTHGRLLLLLSPQCQESPKALEPIAQMILEKSEHSFIMLKSVDIRNALCNEHPFYISSCTAENLLFTNGRNTFPHPENNTIESARSTAQMRYDSGMEKAQSFIEGVYFYKEKENYSLAAFMLHQAIELSYKAIAYSLLKKDKHSHHIKTHINTVIIYIPELGKIFPADNEEEIGLLRTLDQAYLSVRYKNHFQISEETIEILLDRLKQLQKLIKNVFVNYMEKLERLKMANLCNKSSIDRSIHSQSFITQISRSGSSLPPDNIIKSVLERYHAEHIYLLFEDYTKQSVQDCLVKSSTKEEHCTCYLLIITDKGGAEGINVLNTDQLTAYMLVHDRPSVNRAIASGNRFFLTVLNTAPLLYQQEGVALPPIPCFDWQKIYTKAKERWEYRLQLAKAFLKSAVLSHHEICHEQEVALSLLTRFVEQVCLGLFQVFLGYKPNTTNLKTLLHLSKLCSSEIYNILHVQSENDRRLINLLSNSLLKLRFKDTQYVNFGDIQELIHQSEKSLKCLELLCQQELNILKEHMGNSIQQSLSA